MMRAARATEHADIAHGSANYNNCQACVLAPSWIETIACLSADVGVENAISKQTIRRWWFVVLTSDIHAFKQYFTTTAVVVVLLYQPAVRTQSFQFSTLYSLAQEDTSRYSYSMNANIFIYSRPRFKDAHL